MGKDRRGDYDFGLQLGRGSFGVVHRVRRIKDGRVFVCKQIQLNNMAKKARDEANFEVELLKRVSSGSDYIVQYVDSFLEADALHIIMEYCENGDLSKYLKGRGGSLVPERKVWRFLMQIGLGLQWLHQNRILHRDIKTLNVFLTTDDDVRLGDLGVARVLSHNTQFANTFVGTPYYLSPEICEEKPYNEKSDVWAYGCVIYEMCTLKHPFEARNHAALLIKILRGAYAPIHDSFSNELRDMVDFCMKRDITLRPTLAEVFATEVVKSWSDRLGVSLASAGAARASPPIVVKPGRRSPKSGGSRGGSRDDVVVSAPQARGSCNKSTNGGRGAGVAVSAVGALPANRRIAADRPPRARIRGGSAVNAHGAKSQVICAPPSAIVAQERRNRAERGGQGLGPPRRSAPGREDVEAERRRAAREMVAALPDVVVAKPKPPRNAPSVHQLRALTTASSSSVGSDAGSTVAAPFDGEVTMDPQAAQIEALEQEAAAVQEATLRPEAAVSNSAHPVGAGRPPKPPKLRLLQKIDHSAELTHQSAFNGSGSLDLTDTLAYTAASVESEADASHRSFGQEDCDDVMLGSGVDVIVQWGVSSAAADDEEVPESREDVEELEGFDMGEGEESEEAEMPSCVSEDIEGEKDDAEEGFQLTASLDDDGLLCDVGLSGTTATTAATETVEPEQLGEEEEKSATYATPCPEFAAADESSPESPTAASAHTNGAAKTAPAPKPTPPARATPPVQKPDPRAALERRLQSLDKQLQRQHASVVEHLDEPARAIWEELYRLFRAKLAMDESEDDQAEIEQYVFDQLSTESHDFIWKVYKVLHLEAERDRCQQKLLEL